jgi:hypothetical protein
MSTIPPLSAWPCGALHGGHRGGADTRWPSGTEEEEEESLFKADAVATLKEEKERRWF